jgi:hypothetical protein
MIWILNIVIAVIGITVFVGWMRNRRREDYRDIRRAEVCEELAAQDELLEDAINEHTRSRSEWAEPSQAAPRDPAD